MAYKPLPCPSPMERGEVQKRAERPSAIPSANIPLLWRGVGER